MKKRIPEYYPDKVVYWPFYDGGTAVLIFIYVIEFLFLAFGTWSLCADYINHFPEGVKYHIIIFCTGPLSFGIFGLYLYRMRLTQIIVSTHGIKVINPKCKKRQMDICWDNVSEVQHLRNSWYGTLSYRILLKSDIGSKKAKDVYLVIGSVDEKRLREIIPEHFTSSFPKIGWDY